MPATQTKIDQRIADFIASPTDSIDLSGLGIDEIPQMLVDFVKNDRFHIEKINLSHNDMDKLPSNLEDMVHSGTSVVKFNFSHNNIADFAPLMDANINLVEIDISHCPIAGHLDGLFAGWNEAMFDGCSRVAMSNCQLTSLPDKLDVDYEEFKDLDLSHNALTTLPSIGLDDIWGATLNISHNQLAMFPEWLPSKEGLEVLDVRGNPLTVDLATLTAVEKLSAVYVERSQIKGDVPCGIYVEEAQLWLPKADMSDTKFTLTGAGLESIPSFVFEMTELTRLNVSSNKGITEIPRDITKLTKLTGLYVTNTGVTELPEYLAELTELESIGARFTAISTIPDAIIQLPKLTSLAVKETNITEMPLRSGLAIEVSGCRITALPDNFAAINTNEGLNLRNNCLTTLPANLGAALKTLDVRNNQISELPESTSQWALSKLSLDRNALRTVPKDIFNISRLTLAHNPYDGIPEHVSKRGGPELMTALRDGRLPKTGAEVYAELFEQGKTKKYDGLVPDTEAGEPDYGERVGKFTAEYEDQGEEEGGELPEGYTLIYTYEAGYTTIYYAADTRTPQYTVYSDWGGHGEWQYFSDSLNEFLSGFEEYESFE